MHIKSTPVITLLIPILALLASVRAAPSSGLRSRDGVPFTMGWVNLPFEGEIPRDIDLVLEFSVTQQDTSVPTPYHDVIFYLSNPLADDPFVLGYADLGPTTGNEVMVIQVHIPKEAPIGPVVHIFCKYNDNDVTGTSQWFTIAE